MFLKNMFNRHIKKDKTIWAKLKTVKILSTWKEVNINYNNLNSDSDVNWITLRLK